MLPATTCWHSAAGHEQVQLGIEEVEEERDEAGHADADHHDQAERDPGPLLAVGLVGGDQEHRVDQHVAEADTVVVDAESHPQQWVERMREISRDELVRQREHRGENDVVGREPEGEPGHVLQLRGSMTFPKTSCLY